MKLLRKSRHFALLQGTNSRNKPLCFYMERNRNIAATYSGCMDKARVNQLGLLSCGKPEFNRIGKEICIVKRE